MRPNRKADKAQIESEDVAAVNVLNTGDKDINARKIRIEDLRFLIPFLMLVCRNGDKNKARTIFVLPFRKLGIVLEKLPRCIAGDKQSQSAEDEDASIQRSVLESYENVQKNERHI